MEIEAQYVNMSFIMPNVHTKKIEFNGTKEVVPVELSGDQIEQFLSLPVEYRQAVLDVVPPLQHNVLRVQIARAKEALAPRKQAQEIHDKILPHGVTATEQMQFHFAPYPTTLTRTSPFFPLSRAEMAERPYIKDMVIASHSWGTLSYDGPKLSCFEEDYLMILLALICDRNLRIEETIEDGDTYTYSGNIRQILKLKGIDDPGAAYYKAVIDAFKLMSGASFTLTTKKTGKGEKGLDTTYVNNILSNLQYKHGSGNIKVTINPYFYQTYGQNLVTLVDIHIRSLLKGPTAKALHRFVVSHRDDRWNGPILTLAASLNMDIGMPKFRIRERIKKAIEELVNINVLNSKSAVLGDQVELLRTPRKTTPTRISKQ